MCVIMVANQGVRPTEEMVRLGFEHNKFGAGASWQEDGQVKWVKGLDLDAIQKLNLEIPFPYVLHFRVPSSGTSTLPGVCHPFPIEGKVSLALRGATKTGVLFHNGFWAGWKDKVQEAAIKSRFRIPAGVWSDTRGLAWMTSHFGLGILELIDEKVIVMTPKFVYTFGSGWTLEDGVIVSNTHWKTGGKTHYYSGPNHWQARNNQYGSNAGGASGGGPIVGSFPGRDEGTGGHAAGSERRAEGGSDQQEEVQQGAEEAGLPVKEVKEGGAASANPTAEEQMNWVRSLNPKGSSSSSQQDETKLCRECKKNDATVWRHGLGRCCGCWDRIQATERGAQSRSVNAAISEITGDGTYHDEIATASITGTRVTTSMCNLCSMENATRKLLRTREWCCYRCWINRHRPPLVAPGTPLAFESGQVH